MLVMIRSLLTSDVMLAGCVLSSTDDSGCVSCVPMLWRGRASSSRILNDPSLDFCPEGSVTAQGGRDCTGPVAASQNKEAVDDRDNSNDAGNNTQNISNKDDDSHLTREREPEEWGGREEQDRWVTTAIAGGGDEYESSANRNRPAVSAHPSKSNRTNAQNRNRNRSRNNGHISNINSAKATYQVIDPTRQAVEVRTYDLRITPSTQDKLS